MACSSCEKRGRAISAGASALRDGDIARVRRAAAVVAETARRDAAQAAARVSQRLAQLRSSALIRKR